MIVSRSLYKSIPSKLLHFFKDFHVKIVPIESPKGLDCLKDNLAYEGGEEEGDIEEEQLPEKKTWIDIRCLEPEMTRFYYYQQVLNQFYKDPLTRVLIADFRDTVFQEDPFSRPESESDLMIFNERSDVSLLSPPESDLNDGWIERCFGENSLRLLRGREVLCSGNVMGTKQGVSHSLDAAIYLPSSTERIYLASGGG